MPKLEVVIAKLEEKKKITQGVQILHSFKECLLLTLVVFTIEGGFCNKVSRSVGTYTPLYCLFMFVGIPSLFSVLMWLGLPYFKIQDYIVAESLLSQ